MCCVYMRIRYGYCVLFASLFFRSFVSNFKRINRSFMLTHRSMHLLMEIFVQHFCCSFCLNIINIAGWRPIRPLDLSSLFDLFYKYTMRLKHKHKMWPNKALKHFSLSKTWSKHKITLKKNIQQRQKKQWIYSQNTH